MRPMDRDSGIVEKKNKLDAEMWVSGSRGSILSKGCSTCTGPKVGTQNNSRFLA